MFRALRHAVGHLGFPSVAPLHQYARTAHVHGHLVTYCGSSFGICQPFIGLDLGETKYQPSGGSAASRNAGDESLGISLDPALPRHGGRVLYP
jgi:hypothetical protein